MDSSDKLVENPALIKNINGHVQFLWECFDNIVRLKGRSLNDLDIDQTVNLAFHNFLSIIETIPLMASVVNIPLVVRGRPNYHGEVFTKKSQISYNSERPDLIKFGRFNLLGEPLFYASLPTETNNVDYVLSCSLECCKEITAERNNFNPQDITIGGWRVTEPISVVNLCFDEVNLRENPSLQNKVDQHHLLMQECLSKDAAQFIKSFLCYFSELSGTPVKSDFQYFATTALFHAIRYHYREIEKRPIHGLIYPSAMSEKRGLNIVLTPEAADQLLKLDKIVMYRYYPLGYDSVLADACSDLVSPNEAGDFVITNYSTAPHN